jgi:ATP/maltotriose-dependent transcriptional regulator MalT
MPLAKLTQPRSINTIPRSRLFRALDQAGKKPITWLRAPPGAGKTTLVSSYLSHRKLRTLWFQVDSADNDLATFFYYLGLGAPKRKRPMAVFTPEYQMGLSIFTRNFFRELFGRLKPPFVLVFDNYQEIDANSPFQEALQQGLSELPEGGRVIFISRTDAPAPFAMLRAKQAMDVLEWNDIRFTRSEVSELVKRLAPGKWPKSAIDRLHETADGWAAGLVLLLEQLRKDRSTTIDTKRKSSQLLFDYFAGEIFKRTDAETKTVLQQTSFLPRVTAKMAEELTGIESAGAILDRLHKQNYFTNKRAGEDPTYEYHPLFQDFLLSQAKQTYSAEQQREIRRNAADIVKAAGRIEAAAELYRDVEDWDALTKLICEHAPAFLGQGRMVVVEKWIASIPE